MAKLAAKSEGVPWFRKQRGGTGGTSGTGDGTTKRGQTTKIAGPFSRIRVYPAEWESDGMRLGKVVVTLSLFVLMTCVLSMTSGPASAQSATVLYAGKPLQVIVNDWRFLNVTIQDTYAGRTDMVALAVWKDSPFGQTVAVEACGIVLIGGETENCYSPVFNIGHGTYSVSVFVVSIPYDEPLSITLSLNVSV
jgi:hypothetical protein